MKEPNFFIVGAPKCGTTSLAHWLRGHPEVFVSTPKEPHFFNHDHISTYKYTKKQYLRLFKNLSYETKVAGEASTFYLMSDVAIDEILKFNPASKIIVCVRDPLDLAYSHYFQKKMEGVELADSFSEAWSYRFERIKRKQIKIRRNVEPLQLAYNKVASIATQLACLLTKVPHYNVFVIKLDDMKSQSSTVYKDLLHFLCVADDGRTEFPVLNVASQRRKNIVTPGLQKIVRAKYYLGVKYSFGIGQQIVDHYNQKIEKPPIPYNVENEMINELGQEREDLDRYISGRQ